MVQDPPRWRWVELSILGLAVLARSWGLGRRALWFDEAIEYWMAAAPFNQIHQAVASATHDPPFYTYLLKIWGLSGQHEFWLRLPSLGFSLLTVAGVMVLGRESGKRRLGIIAGLFVAISAADIRYAQEVGQYSLLVCLVTWSLIFLLRGVRQAGWGAWLAWGMVTAVGLYTHYGFAIFAVLISGYVAVYLLVFERPKAPKIFLVGSSLIGISLPLLIVIIPQQMNRLGAIWLPLSWAEFRVVSAHMMTFFWISNQGVLEWPFKFVSPVISTAIFLTLMGMALIRTRRWIDPAPLLLILWLGYYLISRSGSYFFVPSRHALFLLPLYMIVSAQGIDWLLDRPRWGKIVGGALMIILVMGSLAAPRDGQEDLRTATAYWLGQGGSSQPTFVYYGATPGFRYQVNLQMEEADSAGWRWYIDCFEGQETPECQSATLVYSPWLRGANAAELKRAVFNHFSDDSEILWGVFSHIHPGEEEAFVLALAEEYQLLGRETFEGAVVLRLGKIEEN